MTSREWRGRCNGQIYPDFRCLGDDGPGGFLKGMLSWLERGESPMFRSLRYGRRTVWDSAPCWCADRDTLEADVLYSRRHRRVARPRDITSGARRPNLARPAMYDGGYPGGRKDTTSPVTPRPVDTAHLIFAQRRIRTNLLW